MAERAENKGEKMIVKRRDNHKAVKAIKQPAMARQQMA